MPLTQIAVCREALDDGNDWSIYFVSAFDTVVDVVVTRVEFEWGDRGHSVTGAQRVTVPAGGVARIWRVSGDDAEVSMSLSLRIYTPTREAPLHFELSRLYRYRDPMLLPQIGLPGWLRRPVSDGFA